MGHFKGIFIEYQQFTQKINFSIIFYRIIFFNRSINSFCNIDPKFHFIDNIEFINEFTERESNFNHTSVHSK